MRLNLKVGKGVTRIVVCVGRISIKFPRLNYGQINFLLGCLCNLRERQKTKWGIYDNLISPSLWCSWGGLIQVMRRVKVRTTIMTSIEYQKFSELTSDRKPGNFGYLEDGKLVCIDYGDK